MARLLTTLLRAIATLAAVTTLVTAARAGEYDKLVAAEKAAWGEIQRAPAKCSVILSKDGTHVVDLHVTKATAAAIIPATAFRLRQLSVFDSEIADDALSAAVMSQTKLQHLYIDGVPLTVEFIKAIRGHKQLTELSLARTQIGNVDGLGDLTQLEVLNLSLNPQIVQGGLRDIGRLKNLRQLVLADGIVGDADGAWIGELKKLTALAIVECPITDDIVPSLLKLPKLRYVNLTDTDISRAGAQRVRDTHSKATVVHDELSIRIVEPDGSVFEVDGQ
jgi:Leucine-rich repeat (LRR) protein